MNTDKIREFLAEVCREVECTRDRKLSLSSILARGQWQGVPTVGIGGDRSTEEQINALVDAVHWCRERHPGASVLRLVIGEGKYRGEVFTALATLISARRPESVPTVEMLLDREATSLPACPTFDGKRWMESIKKRLHDAEPALVKELEEEVDDPSFRWYRGVKAPYWSGRVEGLEVLRFDPKKECNYLKIGRPGREGNRSKAGAEATRLLAEMKDKSIESDVKSAARAIRRIVESRQKGKLRELDYQPEHRLEALALRGKIPIPVGNRLGAGPLKPLFENRLFQFPTQWHTKGKARYVDILMYEGNVPWVVELKYAKRWAGQYFRHAISQAVLYREFIRKAPAVREFLQDERSLCAATCKALVAFPKVQELDSEQLKSLQKLAADFDVEVVTLDNLL